MTSQDIQEHPIEPILWVIRAMQYHGRNERMSVYIDRLKKQICAFEERSPDTPILPVLFAFFEAIAIVQDSPYTSGQFKAAGEILYKVGKKKTVRSKDVEKAIEALGKAGFDTLPCHSPYASEE